ncbi:MAG: hypothetical protein GPJ54_15715 [Candidatus Heimdallarchaeota archaeon]|nr:hypothetical protein [Candidatus Heimdallarchaeota archaeon]
MSIQLAFHNSTLPEDEDKKVETTGMLLLASDFISSGKVNKADKLTRISKINFPLFLFKSKVGQFIPINGFATESITLPIMQLPTLTSIKDFCGERKNLDLNKIYSKLMDFKAAETELVGGYNENQVDTIEELIRSPRGSVSNFTNLPPLRTKTELKEEFAKINEQVYDEISLKKAINERLDIILAVLTEDSNTAGTAYKEKEQVWKVEITNKTANLKRDLTERDKGSKKEIADLDKAMQAKISTNLQNFLDGVAKNIRRDEKPIEASIQTLEKLTKTAKKAEDIAKIDRLLKQLSDESETLRAAIGFATRQVKNTKIKEEDLQANFRIDVEYFKNKAEKDKDVLRENSKKIEERRDQELKGLKSDRDESLTRLTKFKDIRNDWIKDIVSNITTKTIKMISPSVFGDPGNSKIIELKIPMYVFQYDKKGETFTVVVPPVHLPENFRKPKRDSIYGDQKTVYYDLTVPKIQKLIAIKLEQTIQSRDGNAIMQTIPNLLDNPSDLRDTFFNSQSLMIDKLRADKKSIKKANDRLTDVWTSG